MEIAASLGVRMLTPELATERWQHLWMNRCRIGARSFVDLRSARPRHAARFVQLPVELATHARP